MHFRATNAEPADFAPPPDAAVRAHWHDADRAARRERLASLPRRLTSAGLDAYLGVRPEHMRYLTGFALAAGEEKVAGHSGQFLVGLEEVIVLADSRYQIQARREAPEARIEPVGYDLPARLSQATTAVDWVLSDDKGVPDVGCTLQPVLGPSPASRAVPGLCDQLLAPLDRLLDRPSRP